MLKNLIKEDENVLKELAVPIGNITDSVKIHKRTLRLYDKAGILCPQRTKTNFRKYTIKDYEN